MSFFNLYFCKLKAFCTNCIRSLSSKNFLTLNASKLLEQFRYYFASRKSLEERERERERDSISIKKS